MQTMKRGMVGTTKSRLLSAARISSYVGGGFAEEGGGVSTGGEGGSSASVICWQRGHGVVAALVGVEIGGLLTT